METVGETTTAESAASAVAIKSEDSGDSTMNVDALPPNSVDAKIDVTHDKPNEEETTSDVKDVAREPLVQLRTHRATLFFYFITFTDIC